MGWILVILAGGLVTFNAVVTPDKAADAATKALQAKFPDAEVKVVIAGKRGKDVLNGRFKRIDIELANLTLDELPISSTITAPAAPTSAPVTVPDSNEKAQKPAKTPKIKLGRTDVLNLTVRRFKWNKLAVERADFHFENVEYDFGALKNRSQFVLVRAENAAMHLELAPDALTPLVAQRVANVSNPRVSVAGELLAVKGERVFFGVKAPFEIKGTPGFTGKQVILEKPILLVSGVTVPGIVATPLLKSVNPLYSFADLKGLPFEIKLTRVFAREGKLQVDADLKLR